MNLADFLLVTVLAFAFLSSCYLLRQFFLKWRRGDVAGELSQPLNIPWTDLLLYVAGFMLCYVKAYEYVILYSLASILGILTLRRHSPLSFWNLHIRHFPDYLRTGLTTYLTIFLPFGILTAVCAYLFTLAGFQEINQPAVEAFMRSEGLMPILIFLLLACVIAPIWEEITFRGFLYPFLKSKLGRTAALLLSSLLFAAMHQHLPSFIPLTALGVLLALLYERTGSLGYNILLHSFFNFSTCLILLLLKYGSNPQLWKSM
jgi:uncharacterized protein